MNLYAKKYTSMILKTMMYLSKNAFFFSAGQNYLESTLPCPLVLYMNILCCYGNVNCCDSPCLTVDLIKAYRTLPHRVWQSRCHPQHWWLDMCRFLRPPPGDKNYNRDNSNWTLSSDMLAKTHPIRGWSLIHREY